MSRLTRILFVLVGVAIVVSLVFTSSCSISPAPEVSSNVIYVSVSGSDTNDGFTPDSPLKSLPKALELASYVDSETNVEIRVGAGLYTPGNGISTGDFGVVINRGNISIIGGYDSKFENIVGVSEIDGIGVLKRVIVIKDVENVELRNLVIRGGKATVSPYTYGAGIYATNVNKLNIVNVVVSNNVSTNGSGIFFDSVRNSTIDSSIVVSNYAFSSGAGIYLIDSRSNVIDAKVLTNISSSYGGGVYMRNSISNVIKGLVAYNSSGNGGGLYLTTSSSFNRILASIYNNVVTGNGGGIRLFNSPSNTMVDNSVYYNSAQYGGGLSLNNSDWFQGINCWITNNVASTSGGGVYKETLHPNSSFGNVIGNTPDQIAP